MAPAQKSTGLQITLVFAVMLMIIASVVAFLQYRAAGDLQAQLKAADEKRNQAEQAQKKADEQLTNLKAFVGFAGVSDVGRPEADGDGSVIGGLRKTMNEIDKGKLPQSTVKDTIVRLGQELDNARTTRDALTADLAKAKELEMALRGEYQASVDVAVKAQAAAEKDRNEAQASKETAVAAKEKQLAEVTTNMQKVQTELQNTVQEAQKAAEESKKNIDKLMIVNESLKKAKDAIEKPSFEVADGVIEYVDRETNLVWINRGSADNLRPGTTFSVYKQINEGIARGTQDIKGSIEVSDITGPHQSAARITRSKPSDPIIAGDPIYTPLWQSGREENFAFVGLIDLDKDGRSDRDVLHEIVAASGGRIVDEVDDKGTRNPVGGRITVNTKFLVVGNVPDFADARPEDQDAYKKIATMHDTMSKEAAIHGVRVVSLNDFLSYIGYESGRRIWRPGQAQPWNLRHGSRSANTRPGSTRVPVSPGQTSKRYSGDPSMKPPESPGTTSKIFQPKPSGGSSP